MGCGTDASGRRVRLFSLMYFLSGQTTQNHSGVDTSVAAGAISQNLYLFAASNGLATVIRAWIDREAIADALGLSHDQQVLLSQTVGYPVRRQRL